MTTKAKAFLLLKSNKRLLFRVILQCYNIIRRCYYGYKKNSLRTQDKERYVTG